MPPVAGNSRPSVLEEPVFLCPCEPSSGLGPPSPALGNVMNGMCGFQPVRARECGHRDLPGLPPRSCPHGDRDPPGPHGPPAARRWGGRWLARDRGGRGQGHTPPSPHYTPAKGTCAHTKEGTHTHTRVVSAGSRLHTHIQGEKEGESRGPAPKVGRALVPLPAQASPCLVWLLTGSLERAAQGGAGNAGGASFLRGLCLCLCACVKLTGENLSVEAVAWRLEGQQGPLSLARSPAHPSSWLR